MAVKISNNAATTIAGSLTTTATSIALAAGTGSKFPTLAAGDWFPLTLIKATGEREIVKVTARSTDLLTVVRGQEGSAPLTFSAGDKAELRITAAVFTEFNTLLQQAQDAAAAADKTDIGMIVMSGDNTAPSRGTWLKCNGAAVSRTTYASLFARLGTTYGAGNGSTTFNLPDYRGVVPRGLDESRGLDAGRTLSNTVQADQNKSHTHTNTVSTAGSHSHTVSGTTDSAGNHQHDLPTDQSGTFDVPSLYATPNSDENTVGALTGVAGAHTHTFSGTTNTVAAHGHTVTINADGGTEARMKNIATLFWIRAA